MTHSASDSTRAPAAAFSGSSSGVGAGGAHRSSRRSAFTAFHTDVFIGTEGSQVSQSVTVAAAVPLEGLDDFKERDSPRLAGRVHKPLNEEIAADIQGGKMTDLLKGWLKSQNPSWGDGDLRELDELEDDQFWIALSEQAAHYRNRPVFDLVPSYITEAMEEDLSRQVVMLEALVTTIRFPDEQELEAAPDDIGALPFLSHQEREANRKAYFANLNAGMSEELSSWLRSREWPANYVNQFASLATADAIVSELINFSLELDDYGVIQSIPKDHAETIVADLHSAITGNQELLDFIHFHPDSNDETITDTDADENISHVAVTDGPAEEEPT